MLWIHRQYFHILKKWKRKANWIGHILRRNCLLKQVIEGKIKEIEVTRRWGRRRKKLLDDLKDRRGYYHLKEEALDRTMWRNRFGRRVGPVVRQITEWMNESKDRYFLLLFLGLDSQSTAKSLPILGHNSKNSCIVFVILFIFFVCLHSSVLIDPHLQLIYHWNIKECNIFI